MSDSEKKKTPTKKPAVDPPEPKSTQRSAAERAFSALSPPPAIDESLLLLRDAHKVLEAYGDSSLWSKNLTDSLLESQKVYDDLLEQVKLRTQPYLFETVIPSSFQPQVGALQAEIARLRAEINEKVQAVINEKTDSRKKQEQISALERDLAALKERTNLSHLLDRVGSDARDRILSDPLFRAEFASAEPRRSFVFSIDIRRSTDLMLKAKEPSQYARFVTDLASKLREIVLENFGVFDKFTGDGVLGFFPEFFSGPDAGYRAITAADASHRAFAEMFRSHRPSFIAVPRDAGLGIGVDYGNVQIVEVGGAITVVGTPVVYACRMSGAPAGTTLINYPAYHELFSRYSCFDFVESELDVKHEGKTLAYVVRPNQKQFVPALPDWVKRTEEAAGSPAAT